MTYYKLSVASGAVLKVVQLILRNWPEVGEERIERGLENGERSFLFSPSYEFPLAAVTNHHKIGS